MNKLVIVGMFCGILSVANAQTSNQQPQVQTQPQQDENTSGAQSSGIDPTVLLSSARSSKLIGVNVYDGTNDIGTINDILVNLKTGKVSAVILSVGGFLGLGDKLVAVTPDQLRLDGEGKFVTDLAKKELTSAPAFHYGK